MNIDQKDRQLLEILQSNSRTTNAELAKQVELSPSSTLERVKKLEASGIIEKYITLLNPRKAGYTCFTFVEVKLARHGETPVEDFFKSIAKMDEVLECHHITGEADFLLKVATRYSRLRRIDSTPTFRSAQCAKYENICGTFYI